MLTSLSSALLLVFVGGIHSAEIHNDIHLLNKSYYQSFKENSGTYKNSQYHFTLNLPNEWNWKESTSSGATLVTFYPNNYHKSYFYSLTIQKEDNFPSTQEKAFHIGNEGNYIIDGANAAHYIKNTRASEPYRETLIISHNGYLLNFENSHKEDPFFELLYLSFKNTKKQENALQTCNKREKFMQEQWYSPLMEQLSHQYLLYEGAFGSREEVIKIFGTEMITPGWVEQICISPNKENILLVAGVDYMLRGKLFVYSPENDYLERVPDPDYSKESFSTIKNGPNNTVMIYSSFGDGFRASSSIYNFSFNIHQLKPTMHCDYQTIFDEQSQEYRHESDCIIDGVAFHTNSFD